VLAAAQPHHAAWRLADVARAVRAEHERVHELRQPLAHASGAAADVPPGASVALNLALDAGAPTGALARHVGVPLTGLCAARAGVGRSAAPLQSWQLRVVGLPAWQPAPSLTGS